MIGAADRYADAFAMEVSHEYPAIDDFERKMAARVDRNELERAARVLACPLKEHPPNWQHGRVVYAATMKRLRDYIHGKDVAPVLLLDIGTAKGFSALCLQWALRDAGIHGRVVSVDVIDPKEHIARNTVAETDGLKTLMEILEPWREAQSIEFACSTGREWLTRHPLRVHVAFVDGKHTYDAVSWEWVLLAQRQRAGDMIVFDDVQITGVQKAVSEVKGYDVQYLKANQDRAYAVARKL